MEGEGDVEGRVRGERREEWEGERNGHYLTESPYERKKSY